LKNIIKAVDRFCYTHRRFGIPNLMICIVIGNIAVFLLSLAGTVGVTFLNMLVFDAYSILRGQIWRLVTFVFIPQSSSPILLLISLYFYYFLGNTLEKQWGTAKFTIYYLSGMLFMLLYGFVMYFCGYRLTAEISVFYLNMSMFFAFATFYPDTRVLFMFIIPIKMKVLALADLLLFVYEIITAPFPIDLLPVVALLHYFVFCGGWLIDYIKNWFGRRRSKRAYKNGGFTGGGRSAGGFSGPGGTVDFKTAARTVRYRQTAENREPKRTRDIYNRKCEVCGKTDRDHPETEFRYCSRCEGYHCYCDEHINNHIHYR